MTSSKTLIVIERCFILKLNILGTPGPGVSNEHLEKLQLLANETNIGIFVHGSRQTGFSAHTGKPFAATTDLDLGVIGGVKNLLGLLHANWQSVPNVAHEAMRLASIEEALQQKFVIILPQGKSHD